MSRILTLSSGNAHKIEEIQAVLDIPLRGLKELPGVPEFEETGVTFEENALIKARGLRDFLNDWALADDSGLAVEALNGAPGVYSARYAGRHGDDAGNNRKLLQELAGVKNRQAGFVCVLALCGPDGNEWVVRGECRGAIQETATGAGGFGYDPLFVPEGHSISFAELVAEVKNSISHRSNALKALLNHPDRPLERFQK